MTTENEKNAMPLTSILIPAHECRELTVECVESIRRCTAAPYEIILVDDASGPEAAESFRQLEGPDLRLIRNEERQSFSINNNRAAREATGEYLCLLNNDTLVTPGWLTALVETVSRCPDIGVLGNKHLFPDTGKLHHCGMGFDKKGHPIHLHPHTDPSLPAANYEREMQIVTFACVLIPADLYAQMGGLDEDYRNGYEDCDFCLRARQQGRRIVYTPASTIYHYGQRSPDRKSFDDANWQLFQKRWAEHVTKDLDPCTKADRKFNKSDKRQTSIIRHKREGVHFAMDFSAGSAFTWATVELINALRRRGEEVSIPREFGLDRHIDAPKLKLLRACRTRKPCTGYHVKWTHYWKSHLNEPLFGDVNAEFYCNNYRYAPGTQLVDFWTRHVRQNDYRKLAVGRFNALVLEDLGVSPSRVSNVPLGYAPEIDHLFPDGKPESDSSDDLKLLVVTNSHDLSRYGTDILVEALARAFSAADPVVVHIKDYGSGVDDSPLRQWISGRDDFPKVVWHNEFLSKQNLIRLYASMDALVAPFRGEGFGMKVIDAMALGLPVLMPAFGGPIEFAPDGTFIELKHREVPVGDCYDRRNTYLSEDVYWCEVDQEHLTARLKPLIEGRAGLEEIGRRGRDAVLHRYSWDEVAVRFMRALGGFQGSRLAAVSPRKHPSSVPLSVVIPTHRREDTLGKTLDAYREQTLDASDFEIVLVNDHGPAEAVADVVKNHGGDLNVRLLNNEGQSGPAAARNLAIRESRGDILLITGDDIVPDADFLKQHTIAHREMKDVSVAVIGQTHWHPDLEVTPFMEYLDGKGGQQFNYQGMKHAKRVPFDRFYTSNVSLKRAFICDDELMFSTDFPFAAYEDIELAYRLHLRGMRLHYWQTAKGYHDHAMDLRSFSARQLKVGRMLALLAIKQPAFVPPEHTDFLAALEFLRAHRDGLTDLLRQEGGSPGEDFRRALIDTSDRAFQWASRLALESGKRDGELIHSWCEEGAHSAWEALNETVLRHGMAVQWAADEGEAEWMLGCMHMLTLPAIFAQKKRMDTIFAKNRLGDPNALFPTSRMAFGVANLLHSVPVLRSLMMRFESSVVGRKLRRQLLKMMGRT
ncbi:MAG: glycosyltransferase [Verrucomicrobia bacterium]|nr:glycosyltransferase [Verrucomicrobiota bacterium]